MIVNMREKLGKLLEELTALQSGYLVERDVEETPLERAYANGICDGLTAVIVPLRKVLKGG